MFHHFHIDKREVPASSIWRTRASLMLNMSLDSYEISQHNRYPCKPQPRYVYCYELSYSQYREVLESLIWRTCASLYSAQYFVTQLRVFVAQLGISVNHKIATNIATNLYDFYLSAIMLVNVCTLFLKIILKILRSYIIRIPTYFTV